MDEKEELEKVGPVADGGAEQAVKETAAAEANAEEAAGESKQESVEANDATAEEHASQTESAGSKRELDFWDGVAVEALIVFCIVALFAVGAFAGGKSDGLDDRLLACEKQIATLNEKCGISSEDAEKNAGATEEIVGTASTSTAKATTTPAPSETPLATAMVSPTSEPSTKPADTPQATLSPAQIDYFCKVLIISRHGNKDPKNWDSPEEAAKDHWIGVGYPLICDAKEHFEDWLKVAAHPATTATFLHYLAYRCDDAWICEEDDAVKLAKLVLAHKNCDDECIGYLSGSDFQKVRDLVYARLFAASE